MKIIAAVYKDLSKQISETLDRIITIKLAVEKQNLAHTVTVEGAEMILVRAILELSNIRTELGYVTTLLKSGRVTGDADG